MSLHSVEGLIPNLSSPILGIENDRVAAVLLDMPGGDHLAHQLSRRLVGLRRLFRVGNASSEFCQLCKFDGGILLKELCIFCIRSNLRHSSPSLTSYLEHIGALALGHCKNNE